MFEEFYEMYEPEEQEVVALINRCIGGGYNWKGSFWEMTVVTLGMVFCDTGEVTTKEERLEWRSPRRSATVKRAGAPLWERADLPPEDPLDEGGMGKRSGGAPLVYLRDSQGP